MIVRLVLAVILAFAATAAPAYGGVFMGMEADLVDPTKGEQPTLIIGFDEKYFRAQIDIVGENGYSKTHHLKPVSAGQELRYSWSQKEGTVMYTIKVEMVDSAAEHYVEETEAYVSSAPPITASIPPNSVDLAAKQFSLVTNHPPEEVKVEVIADDLSTLGESTFAVTDAKRGSPVRVTWEQTGEGEVFRILVRAFDEYGYWAGVEIIPWSLVVPHEDVNFPTGSHEILADEAPKLEDAWKEIVKALDKYGEWIPNPTLFVGGYTDTVGDASSNQALSERRALAIAQWFAKRSAGRVVIRYQGFGETALAKQTPDGTDEVVNRRAVYIITPGGNPSGSDTPRANWRALK
jgi:outer membrane protein OmpA-like peptidoglycan-associated protein